MSADSDMRKARSRDYGAQIRAIRLALGAAKGLKFTDGRPKPISQDELAERLDVHVSAVKKWELGQQEPEKDSLAKINKIAPPELHFTLGESIAPVLALAPPPEMRDLDDVLTTAARQFVRRPDGQPLTDEEWNRLRAIIRTADKP